MLKITRTTKESFVEFFDANLDTMTIEKHTEPIDFGMTESQVMKHLKAIGYNNPMNIEINNIPSKRIGMYAPLFMQLAEKIEKKSDISGRSVTKELTYATGTAIIAEKRENEWTISSMTVYAFNGEFNSADYNNTYRKILEVSDFTYEKTELFGMSEADFNMYGFEIK